MSLLKEQGFIIKRNFLLHFWNSILKMLSSSVLQDKQSKANHSPRRHKSTEHLSIQILNAESTKGPQQTAQAVSTP